MLDTHSHKTMYPLHEQQAEDARRIIEAKHAQVKAIRQLVWNELVPASAVFAKREPWGVRYLHPTKGWKTIGKRRFAIRGVF